MECAAHNFFRLLAAEQQICGLGTHIGAHKEHHGHTGLGQCFRQKWRDERFCRRAGVGGHVNSLANAELGIAAAEYLKVREEHIVRRAARQVGAGFKHLLRIGGDLLARDPGQLFGNVLVKRRGGRRTEHQRVRQNSGKQQACNLGWDLYTVLFIHAADDSSGAANRLVAEIHRPGSFQCTKTVMVDDLQNLRLLQTIHSLTALVVVHHNDLLAVHVQQITAADDTAIFAIGIQDGKIAVAHIGHDLAGVFHCSIHAEFQQVLAAHKVAHRGSGGNQAGGGVRIKRGGNDNASFFLCAGQNGTRHSRAAADNNGTGATVNGAHLHFVPVGHQHNIAGVHGTIHNFRAGANKNAAGGNAGIGVAQQHFAFQGAEHVFVARLGFCQNLSIK